MDAMAGDKQFFEGISLKTKRFGCMFEGWDIFRPGCFQASDDANKQLHLTHLRSQVNCALINNCNKFRSSIGHKSL